MTTPNDELSRTSQTRAEKARHDILSFAPESTSQFCVAPVYSIESFDDLRKWERETDKIVKSTEFVCDPTVARERRMPVVWHQGTSTLAKREDGLDLAEV